MGELKRAERLQIMLTPEELKLVDDWRFSRRMPSRASAIRELLKRGLVADGFRLGRGRFEVERFRPERRRGIDLEIASNTSPGCCERRIAQQRSRSRFQLRNPDRSGRVVRDFLSGPPC